MKNSVILYGIVNCDSVKKAKKWLEENQICYDLYNYKKEKVNSELINEFLENFDINSLINKRGTTYRNLDDNVKSNINKTNVVDLILTHTSMIKRPILKYKDRMYLGFSKDKYQEIFNTHRVD